MEQYASENRQLREQLGVILENLNGSDRKSRERDLAVSRLQEAIMWLGQDLDALGVPNPYENKAY